MSVRYEIVFECRDRMLGTRMLDRLIDTLGTDAEVRRNEEGPRTWSVEAVFPSRQDAARVLRGEGYRQFCVEVRRSCRSSVFVVPLGPVGSSAGGPTS